MAKYAVTAELMGEFEARDEDEALEAMAELLRESKPKDFEYQIIKKPVQMTREEYEAWLDENVLGDPEADADRATGLYRKLTEVWLAGYRA